MDNAPQPGTRERILIAAATMLGEDPTARLSVRAVAARAQVSTGSLRHFFPTQRELIDTVIAAIHDVDLPDDPIENRSESAEQRLVDCLRLMLSVVGVGEQARQRFAAIYETYVAAPVSDDQVTTFTALERLDRHRIARWLQTLIDEGAMPPGAVEDRARFLSTVLTGLMTERALPTDATRLEAEARTLRRAVQAVLTDDPAEEATHDEHAPAPPAR